MEDILRSIGMLTGLQPETLLLLLGVIVASSNLLGRVIPDDATGVLGVLRKAAKLIGLYASNRVAKGISVNDVVRGAEAAVKEEVSNQIQDTVIPQIKTVVAETNPFQRGPDGKFQKVKK